MSLEHCQLLTKGEIQSASSDASETAERGHQSKDSWSLDRWRVACSIKRLVAPCFHRSAGFFVGLKWISSCNLFVPGRMKRPRPSLAH
jgi:hypothetical protein